MKEELNEALVHLRAINAVLDGLLTGAQPAPAAPSGWNLVPYWVAFDGAMNVLTIHGKQYAAPLFGLNGFLAAPGTVLRIEEGLDGVVTFSKVAAAPAAPSADRAAQWLVEVRDQFRGIAEQANQALTRHVADLAQPAHSAMEADDLAILEAVRRELEEDDEGNAPGHSHYEPGIWDDDNGAKAGKPCAWCLTWKKFTALIDRDRARTLSAASNKEIDRGL